MGSAATKAAPPKYRDVRDKLLARIQRGEYPVSSQLPTIQDSSRQFGVSYVTTQRAYRLLAEEGVVELCKGPRGTRVLRASLPTQTRRLTVGALFRPLRERNEIDNFALDMNEAVCGEMSKRHVGVVHYRIDNPRATERLLDCVEQGRVDGVLLDQLVPDRVVRQVARTGCPAVVYSRHPHEPIVDSVSPDMVWIGRETGRRALERGYQRVVVCNVWRPELHQDEEGRIRHESHGAYVDGIAQALRSGGLPDEQIAFSCEPLPEHADLWRDQEYFRRYLGIPDRPDGVPTAFIDSSDMQALRVAGVLRARGFRTPEDAGVIGLFDFECNRAAERPVTTWRIDPLEIGRAAVETLLERIEFPGRERVRRYLRPRFMDHGTL